MRFAVSIALILFSFSMSSFAKTIIITDIDDTIRQSNVVNKLDAGIRLLGTPDTFKGLASIYERFAELAEEDYGTILPIAYISASIPFFYNAEKWRKEKHLPKGPAFQRESLSEDKLLFKKGYIKKFLKENYDSGDQVLFFGDNAELDPQIYSEVSQEIGLLNAKIFIRDIRAINTKYSPEGKKEGRKGINYFFSEVDLLKLSEFRNLGSVRANKILHDAETLDLIPGFVIGRIASRLKGCVPSKNTDQQKCLERAKSFISANMKNDLSVLKCFYNASAEDIAKLKDDEILSNCRASL